MNLIEDSIEKAIKYEDKYNSKKIRRIVFIDDGEIKEND